MFHHRSSGILLHLSSLPSLEGIGTLGKQAHRWIDRLAEAGQNLWQLLPLGPTGYGDSPYQSYSAFAGNPLFIDLELLVQRGWLRNEELGAAAPKEEARVDYSQVRAIKDPLLRTAYERARSGQGDEWERGFRAFELSQMDWLEEYALFMALHSYFGGRPWSQWPRELRLREHAAIEAARREHFEELEYLKFLQYLFFDQWSSLKEHAAKRGVKIVGDLPIYVAFDSSDCWAAPENFLLDGELQPTFVAGVPPDYFSETGQLWGNPLYDWEHMQEEGYDWWIGRMRHSLEIFDLVRIDHFRGFEAYWAVPAQARTAAEGEWRPGPGATLFEALEEALGGLPVIAEDLGIITPAVEELRDGLGLPGMKILQFAFGGDASNPYLPHNHRRNCVLYTGTHDNDTTLGWLRSLADRSHLMRYLGCKEEELLWELIRTLQSSVARMAVLPLQDLLGLGSEARMNTPGTVEGNWSWRCTYDQMEHSSEAFERLVQMSRLYGRA